MQSELIKLKIAVHQSRIRINEVEKEVAELRSNPDIEKLKRLVNRQKKLAETIDKILLEM